MMNDERYSTFGEKAIYDKEAREILSIMDVCERLNTYESNLDSLLGFMKEVYDEICEKGEDYR
jgi:hypothetical protein